MQLKFILCLLISLAFTNQVNAEPTPPTATNKTEYGDYRDWRVLGVSHRLDRQYVRAIVGNNMAIKAGRTGKNKPWPDGTIIAKLSWKQKTDPNWPQAIVPGEFVSAEAMVKDAKKYAETGGWGFGLWQGKTLVIYDKDRSAPCLACHTPMKDQDYVFTNPVLQ